MLCADDHVSHKRNVSQGDESSERKRACGVNQKSLFSFGFNMQIRTSVGDIIVTQANPVPGKSDSHCEQATRLVCSHCNTEFAHAPALREHQKMHMRRKMKLKVAHLCHVDLVVY